MTAGARYRIGFDIGGTFTDFILLDTERSEIRPHKCLTTPEDPSVGALAGLAEITEASGLRLADIGEIVDGTTLVTNALIERKGAKLGLITTAGFRDLLEMGTEQRYDIYDLFLRYPEPLVPGRRRLEVRERIDRDGNVVVALDLAEVRDAARTLVAAGVEAIAVGFLHSYRNPAHRARHRRGDQSPFPRHLRIALVGRRGGTLGISTYRDNLRQRVRATVNGPVCPAPRTRALATRISRRTVADAFGGRAGVAGNRACLSDPAAGVRAGRRRSGHRVFRRNRGQEGRHLLRHGRHDGESVPDRERPRRGRGGDGSRPRPSVQEGLRAPGEGAGDRHDRDRGRWRLHRVRRRGRSATSPAPIPPAPFLGPPVTAAAARGRP